MSDSTQYDWSKFEIVFYYDRPLDEVFTAWGTGGGLERFFIEEAKLKDRNGESKAKDTYFAVGDRYHWRSRHDFKMKGEITAFRPNEQVSFTFGSQMHVDVYFAEIEAENQVEVHMVQTNIPNTEEGRVWGHLNCRSCWIFFMTNLKSVFDTGRDLRDERSDRASSMEVGFVPLSGGLL